MIADKPIFALVIAIDTYKNKSIPSLEGCGLDGADFVHFLTNTLRVPESRIIQLNNEQATRSAILAAFQCAFIENDKIEHGDAMVFFYAGHGDRVKAPVGWTANDDMIEMICPFDLETPDDNGVPIPGIPDRTFDSLMRYLASVKGDNIVRASPDHSVDRQPDRPRA
ncbi:uncharacterized protein C8Q71DRAFT_714572 [Rhodofomes roseus]|uniref:Peptidase C14 caspase domain-containing protein n=1 Tax=Rhodofomes roseus TaxID=34475 RepID=A0ABQ8K4U3_9APHY|nr:uncharacterized protein C8Q71DRAFT_714572 [Rhodofomes roseus]KAH9831958.1 hypothetical protein C8Q71DRAFT_714572 [Rhodofomes roseus]